MKTISFIGGGRITKIMIKAFENAGITFEKTVVYDINPEALKAVKGKFNLVNTTENLGDVLSADLIFLATHPPVTIETLEKIKGKLNSQAVLVSLVPKINIQKTIAVLENFTNVARMNPSASTM
jgi:pyrroline-5-carboxylate reductase